MLRNRLTRQGPLWVWKERSTQTRPGPISIHRFFKGICAPARIWTLDGSIETNSHGNWAWGSCHSSSSYFHWRIAYAPLRGKRAGTCPGLKNTHSYSQVASNIWVAFILSSILRASQKIPLLCWKSQNSAKKLLGLFLKFQGCTKSSRALSKTYE